MTNLTLRGLAMSTAAYITALTIGVFSVTMAKSYADDNVTELQKTPVMVAAPVVDPLVKYRNAKELTQQELIELLAAVGFEGKGLRTAWAVVMKESRGRPVAHNDNINTGDNSYGLFQINMIGGLGHDRLVKFQERFGIKTKAELFNPVVNAQAAYYMTKQGTDWGSWGLGSNAYDGTAAEPLIDKWLKQYPSKS